MTFEALSDSADFGTLDKKLGLSLTKTLHGDFARVVGNLEEEASKTGHGLKEANIAHDLCAVRAENYRSSSVEPARHDWSQAHRLFEA